MVSTYIQTAIGIAVSVILFVVGYRQTIGARKERAKAANASLLRALLRRLVLEAYEPNHNTLQRLIEGRALEYEVRVTDLLTVDQLLNLVFAQVFDSELVSAERRIEVERRLSQAAMQARKIQEQATTPSAQVSRHPVTYTTALALSTALVGVAVVFIPELLKGQFFNMEVLATVGSVIVGSLAVIFAIVSLRRARDSGETSPAFDFKIPSLRLPESIQVHERVVATLEKLKLNYEQSVPLPNYYPLADFVVELPNRRIVLTLVPSHLAPPAVLLREAESTHAILEQAEATHGVIVVGDGQSIPKTPFQNISIVSVGGLEKYLRAALLSAA